MENPYAVPRSEIAERNGDIPIYSPGQVVAGTFLGGPVGLIYFLRANFITLGNERLAKMSLAGGAILMLALWVLLLLLPAGFPSFPITIAYMVVGQQVAIKHQMTRQAIGASTLYRCESNGRVVGLGLLCLVASLVLIMGPLLLFGMMGIVQ